MKTTIEGNNEPCNREQYGAPDRVQTIGGGKGFSTVTQDKRILCNISLILNKFIHKCLQKQTRTSGFQVLSLLSENTIYLNKIW